MANEDDVNVDDVNADDVNEDDVNAEVANKDDCAMEVDGGSLEDVDDEVIDDE